MCFSLEETDAIIAAAQESGKVAQVGYVKLYEPAFEAALLEVRAMIAERARLFAMRPAPRQGGVRNEARDAAGAFAERRCAYGDSAQGLLETRVEDRVVVEVQKHVVIGGADPPHGRCASHALGQAVVDPVEHGPLKDCGQAVDVFEPDGPIRVAAGVEHGANLIDELAQA